MKIIIINIFVKFQPHFTMRMTLGFMSIDIKPDIVLISYKDDIRLYVMLTNNKVTIILCRTSTQLIFVDE